MNNMRLVFLFCMLTYLVNAPLDLFSQGWEKLGNSPFVTHHSNGYSYNGRAYIIEGTNNNPTNQTGKNRLWEYNPETQVWTYLKDFDGPYRELAIGDEWNEKYYYGFGDSSSGYNQDLWVFDAADLSFTELPSCPGPGRSHPALIAHNEKVFMGAGSSSNGDLDDWWEYDMITEEWTQKEDIPGPVRHHPFFFAYEDKVYVGGGHVSSWYSFDMLTDTWEEIDDDPKGRVAGTQIDFGSLGFIVGGDTDSHSNLPIEESFMMYDMESQEWNKLPQLPEGSRWAPSSFILDEELYFFGGFAYQEGIDTSMWKFDLNLLNCLPAVNMNAFNLTESTADLSWLSTSSSIIDTLKYREVGSSEWINIVDPQAVFTLDNLEECTTYEFAIYSQCDSLLTYSNTFEFRTKGCGICLDADYCSSPDIIGGIDFINAFGINEYINESGNNGGYANFTLDASEEILIGETFELYFDPGSEFGYFDLNFSVWVDLNANGEFENTERIFAKANVAGPINADVMIPEDAVEGPTRLRLTLIYEQIGEACDNTNFGEVEDYCISLKAPVSNENTEGAFANEILISPNPFVDAFTFATKNLEDENFNLRVTDMQGKIVFEEINVNSGAKMNLSHLAPGIYFLSSTNQKNETTVNKITKL